MTISQLLLKGSGFGFSILTAVGTLKALPNPIALPDCSVFGIDWEGPQGWGRVEFVMPREGGRATLYTERMGPTFVKELLNQLVDECIVEE